MIMPQKRKEQKEAEKRVGSVDEEIAGGGCGRETRSYYYDDACGYEVYLPDGEEPDAEEDHTGAKNDLTQGDSH